MTLKASAFRYANVLPNPLINDFAGLTIEAIRFLPGFEKESKWWKYEEFVEIDFLDKTDSEIERIQSTCGACGLCCQDIPTHQIGIYMSPKEISLAQESGHVLKVQGQIEVEGMKFQVLGVKENGDCAMLGPKGCTLGDLKPLWCKIYHCEKYQDRPYMFTKQDTPSDPKRPSP